MKLDEVWFTDEQPRPGERTPRANFTRITDKQKSNINGVDEIETAARAMPVGDGGKHLLVPVVVVKYRGQAIELPWHTVKRYVVSP